MFGLTKLFSIIFFLISLLPLIFGLTKVLQSGLLIDFAAFYDSSRLFLTGGNPYTLPHPFNYPPALLLFLSPIVIFPIKTAQTIFTLMSLTSLILTCILLLKLFIKSWTLILLLTALILQLFPVKFALAMGQVNLLVLFFVSLSFIYEQKNKQITSGIFFSLASILKVIPLTLCLYFLVRGRFKTLLSGVLIFISTNLLIVLVSGWTSSYFLTAIPHFFLNSNNADSIYDQSLKALFVRLGFDTYSGLLSIFITFFFFTAATIIYWKRRKFKNNLNTTSQNFSFFSLILAITTIGNSYAWQHHFILLVPGFISEVVCSKGLIRKTSLILSVILVAYHFPDPLNPPTTNPFLISHTLIGSLILIILLLTQKIRSVVIK